MATIIATAKSYLKKAGKNYGVTYVVTSGQRSAQRDYQLAKQYGYSWNYPSQHVYNLAFDAVARPAGAQSLLGSIWVSFGYYWHSADVVHFAIFDPNTWLRILIKWGVVQAEKPIIPTGGQLREETFIEQAWPSDRPTSPQDIVGRVIGGILGTVIPGYQANVKQAGKGYLLAAADTGFAGGVGAGVARNGRPEEGSATAVLVRSDTANRIGDPVALSAAANKFKASLATLTREQLEANFLSIYPRGTPSMLERNDLENYLTAKWAQTHLA